MTGHVARPVLVLVTVGCCLLLLVRTRPQLPQVEPPSPPSQMFGSLHELSSSALMGTTVSTYLLCYQAQTLPLCRVIMWGVYDYGNSAVTSISVSRLNNANPYPFALLICIMSSVWFTLLV